MFLWSKQRRSRFEIYFVLVLLVFLLSCCHQNVEGQSNKVSSKLDFDDTEDKSNSSIPIGSGVGQEGRGSGAGRSNNSGNSRSGNRGRDSEDDDFDDDTEKGKNNGKTGPKIHGVRVTVDTGDGKKSKESKESVEITDLGKHRKRVGIHTDITFEITADGADVLNATSTQRDDKDASVPVFRGRAGHGHGSSSSGKPRKPYDPRTQWNPNFSAERRNGYDIGYSSGHGGSGYYPQYPSYNVPVYTGSGDAGRSSGGSIYRQGDGGWNNYQPSWTTERSYNEYYLPSSGKGRRAESWKPCYCSTAYADSRRRRDSKPEATEVLSKTLRAMTPILEIVDGKVEQPFSRK